MTATVAGGMSTGDNIYILNGDGWDMSNKAILMSGDHLIDNILVFNCSIENWRTVKKSTEAPRARICSGRSIYLIAPFRARAGMR